jgi:hypothetical protein
MYSPVVDHFVHLKGQSLCDQASILYNLLKVVLPNNTSKHTNSDLFHSFLNIRVSHTVGNFDAVYNSVKKDYICLKLNVVFADAYLAILKYLGLLVNFYYRLRYWVDYMQTWI